MQLPFMPLALETQIGIQTLIMKHLSFLSFPSPQLIQLPHWTLSIISSLWQQESKSRQGKLIIIAVSRRRMQSEFNVEANTNTNKPYLFFWKSAEFLPLPPSPRAANDSGQERDISTNVGIRNWFSSPACTTTGTRDWNWSRDLGASEETTKIQNPPGPCGK